VAFDAPGWTSPATVVIDTNVVAEALLPEAPERAACSAMLDRLGAEETLVVFNRLLEVELWEVVFNKTLHRDVPRQQARHRRLSLDGRTGAVSALRVAEREWQRMLGTWNSQCIEVHEVADAVPDLMCSYGLQSYDAVHAATLLASGATDIVTRDTGFAALLPEDATIHTTTPRVSRTRARRRAVSAVAAD
jgi:predicted nucleic acid-binding protein